MYHKYLIRLDDACPMMDSYKWKKVEAILDLVDIKPLVGVIPCNEDLEISVDAYDAMFWEKVHIWIEKGWAIALHGYNHKCITFGGMEGLNPFWRRSEFAGVPLEKQREKIRRGVNILHNHDIYPQYFFAPFHTYDMNTLEALRQESDIRIISDTIANRPYIDNDFIFIPQFGGRCVEIRIPGIWTFCLHPTMMTDYHIKCLEKFLFEHRQEFLSFADLDFREISKKNLFSRGLSWSYFMFRRLSGKK